MARRKRIEAARVEEKKTRSNQITQDICSIMHVKGILLFHKERLK
jgi:hypothetical protein